MAGVTGTTRQVQQHKLEMDQAQDIFSARCQSRAQDSFHLGHPKARRAGSRLLRRRTGYKRILVGEG